MKRIHHRNTNKSYYKENIQPMTFDSVGSMLAGGDFGQGFQSGAYRHLYNDVAWDYLNTHGPSVEKVRQAYKDMTGSYNKMKPFIMSASKIAGDAYCTPIPEIAAYSYLAGGYIASVAFPPVTPVYISGIAPAFAVIQAKSYGP